MHVESCSSLIDYAILYCACFICCTTIAIVLFCFVLCFKEQTNRIGGAARVLQVRKKEAKWASGNQETGSLVSHAGIQILILSLNFSSIFEPFVAEWRLEMLLQVCRLMLTLISLQSSFLPTMSPLSITSISGWRVQRQL